MSFGVVVVSQQGSHIVGFLLLAFYMSPPEYSKRAIAQPALWWMHLNRLIKDPFQNLARQDHDIDITANVTKVQRACWALYIYLGSHAVALHRLISICCHPGGSADSSWAMRSVSFCIETLLVNALLKRQCRWVSSLLNVFVCYPKYSFESPCSRST